MRVRLDEIVPTKAAARRLPQELQRLERAEVDQLVLTTRNVARGVLITVDRYEELLIKAGELEPGPEQLAA
jgi:hypothetical protein